MSFLPSYKCDHISTFIMSRFLFLFVLDQKRKYGSGSVEPGLLLRGDGSSVETAASAARAGKTRVQAHLRKA